MNSKIGLLALVEILSAISIGIFLLVLTFKIVEWVGKKYYDIETFNLSYSIFAASIILSVGIMISGMLDPLLSSFRLLTFQEDGFMTILKYVGTGLVYIAIAYTATIFIGLISTFLYAKVTPMNEFEEIKKNNVGVAIIVASIIITLTLLTKNGVILLIESIIPYPELPPI